MHDNLTCVHGFFTQSRNTRGANSPWNVRHLRAQSAETTAGTVAAVTSASTSVADRTAGTVAAATSASTVGRNTTAGLCKQIWKIQSCRHPPSPYREWQVARDLSPGARFPASPGTADGSSRWQRSWLYTIIASMRHCNHQCNQPPHDAMKRERKLEPNEKKVPTGFLQAPHLWRA